MAGIGPAVARRDSGSGVAEELAGAVACAMCTVHSEFSSAQAGLRIAPLGANSGAEKAARRRRINKANIARYCRSARLYGGDADFF